MNCLKAPGRKSDNVGITTYCVTLVNRRFHYGGFDMKEEIYKIDGMSCAACSSAVERVTRKLPGVQKSDVNLTTGRMDIVYDESQVAPEIIMAKVEKAGFGISLATEDRKEREKEEKEKEESLKEAKHRLTWAIVFSVPLLYLAMGHMLPFELPLPQAIQMEVHPLRFAVLQLILTLPVLYFGRNFYIKGFHTLFRGNPNMDSLVAIGTSAAFLYSLVMTLMIPSDMHKVHYLYFESAAVVVTLVMLGKYLEKRSKRKTSEAIKKLMELAPDTAILLVDGQEKEVPSETLRTGDIVRVKAGMKVPVDGIVTNGSSSVDESMLTGESIPVEKAEGSEVIGGSLNFEGLLQIEVTRTGNETTLSKIVKLMEEAQGKKAPISKVADQVAGYFVPAVMGIAFIAACIWLILGYGIGFAVNIFVSVLVIACPCALGLATPTAIMVGTGLAASHGILIKSGEALELTHKIDAVVLDKTGTITEGRPRVIKIVSASEDETELIRLAAAAEAGSEHPLAQAIVREAGYRNVLEQNLVKEFKNISGMGACAVLTTGQEVQVGNRKLLDSLGISLEQDTTSGQIEDRILFAEEAEKLAAKGQTPMFVVINQKLSGIISVADAMKESSQEAVDALKQMGLKVYMLTGDNRLTAEYIGRLAHVDEVIAEVLPGEKAAAVEKLQAEGKKVMMVGDGINDAPALVQADIGTAIGNGSDIAIDSADIVLMRSDLMDVYQAVHLSRLTIRNIKQNLFWAFFYNTIGIPVAAGLLYPINGTLLSPMIGGFAMSLSSVFVVGNALRLRRAKLQAR